MGPAVLRRHGKYGIASVGRPEKLMENLQNKPGAFMSFQDFMIERFFSVSGCFWISL